MKMGIPEIELSDWYEYGARFYDFEINSIIPEIAVIVFQFRVVADLRCQFRSCS
jgi:hypothetical protein